MKFAFIFPGQGSQAVGMGKDFFDNYEIAKELFDTTSDILKTDMKKLLFNNNDDINKTQFTQPAILLVSYIAYILFNKNNKKVPVFGLGHSLGEITANVIAKSISFKNAISLVHKRGELMQKACENVNAGMAVVIGLDDKILEDFCKSKKNIYCANYNTDGQNVIAGEKEALINIENDIKKMGAKRFLILPMSIASHCPLLESISDEFKEILNDALIDNFDFEILSNANMESYKSKNKAIELLTMQLTKPVFYKQLIKNNQNKVDCFIEFGYGNILKGLNKRISDKPTYCISDIQSLQNTLNEINK